MCGIYGAINTNKKMGQLNEKLLKLNHRGPDSHDFYYNEDKKIYLGHTRLSILDLNSSANQPFQDNEHVLIYNGEIYNYLELKEKYLKEEKFNTCSDTEVIFKLLKKFYTNIIVEFNGMFSFAFYDINNAELLVARDRMGIKPLYYYQENDMFEFASEVKSLDYEIDSYKVKDYFTTRTYQRGNLPYKKIVEFPSGSFVKCNFITNSFVFNKYFDLFNVPKKLIYDNYKNDGLYNSMNKLEMFLDNSVQIHLRSDAKIASLCSGGLDSSLISAIATQYDSNISLYHAGVEGNGGEEKYSEIVAKHLKKEITYTKINKELFWHDFPYLTYISDLPIYHQNDVLLHQISKKARLDGVKVLLSGEGADELFGGYKWHQNIYKKYKIFRFLSQHPLLNKLFANILFEFSKNGLNSINLENFKSFIPQGLGYNYSNVDSTVKGHILVKNNFKDWILWEKSLSSYEKFDEFEEKNIVLSLMMDNLQGHLGTILHRTDRIMMANSIEGRVPFLENSIIEMGLNLPFDYKINSSGKLILKLVAEKYLPKSVIYRKKAGFPVPWKAYVDGIHKIFENGFILDMSGLTLKQLENFYIGDANLKFMLIALEVWGRIFVLKQDYKNIVVE